MNILRRLSWTKAVMVAKAVIMATPGTCRRYRNRTLAAFPRYPCIRFVISFVFVFNGHAHVQQNSDRKAIEQKLDELAAVMKHIHNAGLETYVNSLKGKNLLHPTVLALVRYLSCSLIRFVFITSAHYSRSMNQTLTTSSTPKAKPSPTRTSVFSWPTQKI